MVVIAHRLSTLRLCDRILVLEGGRVRGFDTPERLEEDNAYFHQAVNSLVGPECGAVTDPALTDCSPSGFKVLVCITGISGGG